MTTKTYSEARQEAYFRAAIELYRIAKLAAEDTDPETNPSEANRKWVAALIDNTFEKAYALETLGHEECIASTRWENRLKRERAGVPTTENRRLKAAILAKLAT